MKSGEKNVQQKKMNKTSEAQEYTAKKEENNDDAVKGEAREYTANEELKEKKRIDDKVNMSLDMKLKSALEEQHWMLHQTSKDGGGHLKDEEGREMTRRLGWNDGQKRRAMVASVKQEVKCNAMNLMVEERNKENWYQVNIGKTLYK